MDQDSPLPDPSIDHLLQVDQVCDSYEAEFRDGQSPEIPVFLGTVAGDDRDELLTALVGLDLELRSGSGDSCSFADYLKQFPGDREAIEAAFREAGLEESISADVSKVETVSQLDALADTVATHQTTKSEESSIQSLPEQIGRFEIQSVLGEGAFGRVYRARDPKLNRDVALKVPSTNVQMTEEATKRFFREGRAAAALRHPGICPVFELGDEGETPFIAMAYIEGETLAQRNRTRSYSLLETARLVQKLAAALAHAHKKGVVHRDLKPGNIMFDAEQGDPVIMDFGLAHFAEPGESMLTQSSMVMGTPTHMSPEQARGAIDEINELSDVYSLGVIFYELLTQQLPFTGSIGEVLGKIQHVAPEAPTSVRPDLDPKLEAICMKAMAKDPAERYQSMNEFSSALKSWEKAKLAAQTIEDTVKLESKTDAPLDGGSKSRRWMIPVVSGALVLLFAFLAQSGILFQIETEAGMVMVQIDGEGKPLRVDISEDKTITLTDPNDGKDITITVDREKKQLQLEKEGFKLATTSFKLTGQDGQSVTVTFTPKPPTKYQHEAQASESVASPSGPDGIHSLAIQASKDHSNYALAFDGKDDSVGLPRLKLDGSEPFTVEISVVPNSDVEPGSCVFVDNMVVDIRLLSSRKGRHWVGGGRVSGKKKLVSRCKFDAKPSSLALVYDMNTVVLFVDGLKSQESTLIWDGGDLPQTGSQRLMTTETFQGAFLGNWHLAGQDPFHGIIDEVRISNIARYTEDYTPVDRFENDEHTLALYHFDEGQGDVLKDFSGNGHHGQIHGAKWVPVDDQLNVLQPYEHEAQASESTTSKPGPDGIHSLARRASKDHGNYALEFDGKSDQVRVTSLNFDGDQPATIEVKCRIYSEPEGQCQIVCSPSLFIARENFALPKWDSSGRVIDGPALDLDAIGKGGRATLALTFDKKTTSFFVDGIKSTLPVHVDIDGRDQVWKEQPVVLESGNLLTMGGHWTNQYFHGIIDEVRISNVARYTEDYTPVDRFENDEHTLALYHFDEGQGDVLKDASGNGHHGQIHGANWVKVDRELRVITE